MPKPTPQIPLPGIQLDASASLPLHRQLYEQLGRAIRAGYLTPGTRLPSTRAFARELGVSRTTIEEAYQDLSAEGYIEGQVGAGTYVTKHLSESLFQVTTMSTEVAQPSVPVSGYAGLSQRGRQITTLSLPPGFGSGDARYPFRIGLPALESFPLQEWTQTVTRVLRQLSPSLLSYPDPAGFRPLREEIATYLTLSRGCRCTADQVIVVAGAQAGLSLAARLLLDARDAAWIEDPGYPYAKAAFEDVGATVVPVPIDEEGIDVGIGKARCPDARLAYVTPSHQFPLGVTMSLARRYELLHWAQAAGAWIIEDDYDSEYRYLGRPIPALQGLEGAEHVLYLGTFSKVLFPALRLGYLVVPPSLVDAFVAALRTANVFLPILEQAAVATYMREGNFARHIRRMRSLYAKRGNFLWDCARSSLGEVLTIERPAAGLHLVGWLPKSTDDREMARKAERQRIIVSPLSAYRMEPTGRGGVLLSYASWTEREIEEGVQRLARAWNTRQG
ncbi:PLP-dependent aminotransferase family protein [Ktedonosporobacter rubrisoli]|uniref:PLP-dependent aminotransferase family protein n=1 Tax=Ktedonosporobacter rubrisoli TaxID=2509675 RepID=A0A4P6JJV1_KTERU|nr:PLP-dependent aminotransferase family protein [Ktedonosporobacter rubrisoli]QBD74916.1 PLP-dependent aminotransferase family protein [Ktedonosporobacter rubrisoli]